MENSNKQEINKSVGRSCEQLHGVVDLVNGLSAYSGDMSKFIEVKHREAISKFKQDKYV